jgi:deoxyribodipyrimidine photolyase
MQRAQRASDNPALDLAVELGNELRQPVVVFLGINPFVERANYRHYRFLAEGLAGIAEGLRARRVGFVLRAHPHHRLRPFLDEVRPAIVIGDENPLRQTERWREQIAEQVAAPFWTVDADVVVPSLLLETEQYAARTIRPRLHKRLAEFLVRSTEPVASVRWAPQTPPAGERPSPALLARSIEALPSPARSPVAAPKAGGGCGNSCATASARTTASGTIPSVTAHHAFRRTCTSAISARARRRSPPANRTPLATRSTHSSSS